MERIVFMDNLIIGTAMAELTSFPSIPVKVTLDEYIEISKYYSTPAAALSSTACWTRSSIRSPPKAASRKRAAA